jgi:hypothetical protein
VRSYRGVGGEQRKPIDALSGTVFIRLLPLLLSEAPAVSRESILILGERQSTSSFRQVADPVLLLMFALLAGCSDLALPSEDMPVSGPDPGYNNLVANYLKNNFKNRASYDAFAISAFRWVHSFKGWAWMTCVRFEDSGHPRTYAVFIKDRNVINSRYAVQTDACNTQTYAAFDAMGPTRAGVLGPLY